MDDAERKKILETLYLEILTDLILNLLEQFDLLEGTPALHEAFPQTLIDAIDSASESFIALTGAASIAEIDPQLATNGQIFIIGTINDALPKECPYVAALIYSPQESATRPGAIRRSLVPGGHELLSWRVTPIVAVDNFTQNTVQRIFLGQGANNELDMTEFENDVDDTS